jgi:hypothetical protein
VTIEVVIRRAGNGTLTACVKQGGQYGRNILLGRSIRDVGNAQGVAKQKLAAEFLKVGELEIVWTVKA